MLALIAILGAVFAAILAAPPIREFFELVILPGGQWFLALLCVAIGLGIAGAGWQLPYIQRLELPEGEALEPDDGPEPTHTPRTNEFAAVARDPEDAADAADPATRVAAPDELPTDTMPPR